MLAHRKELLAVVAAVLHEGGGQSAQHPEFSTAEGSSRNHLDISIALLALAG